MSDDWLERLRNASADERAWLVFEFNLASLPPAVRELVVPAAVPRWFDRELLAAVAGRPVPEADFAILAERSFVERLERGCNLHEQTRALVLNRLWAEDRARYRELSGRAAGYCADRALADPLWRIEAVYHRLVADPARGADELWDAGWAWSRPPAFDLGKLEGLARAAREQREGGRLDARAAGVALFWEAMAHYHGGRLGKAKSVLLSISAPPDGDLRLAANTALWLTLVCFRLAQLDEARARLESARRLAAALGTPVEQAHSRWLLGLVQAGLGEPREAHRLFLRALRVYRREGARFETANCLLSLAGARLALGDSRGARRGYRKALRLYRKLGERHGEAQTLMALGQLDMGEERWEAARGNLDAALAIWRDWESGLGEANCLTALGCLALAQADWAGAQQSCRTALAYYRAEELDAEAAFALQVLGLAEKGAGNRDAARRNFTEALALARKLGLPSAAEIEAELAGLG